MPRCLCFFFFFVWAVFNCFVFSSGFVLRSFGSVPVSFFCFFLVLGYFFFVFFLALRYVLWCDVVFFLSGHPHQRRMCSVREGIRQIRRRVHLADGITEIELHRWRTADTTSNSSR